MSLVTLKTNLKSLKYGNDRPGGGSSNQPYIQKPIPPGDLPFVSGPDFKLRGGNLAYIEATNDVSALSQLLLEDKKNPNFFITKMNLLSRMSVRTEMSRIENQGSYALSNTLSQVELGALGFHFNTFNQIPRLIPLSETYDQYMTGQKLEERWSDYNRLNTARIAITNGKNKSPKGTILYKINPYGGGLAAATRDFINNLFDDPNLNTAEGITGKYGVDPGPSVFIRYGGGPGASNGTGNTTIKFASYRTGVNKSIYIQDNNGLSPRTLGYPQLSTQFGKENGSGNITNILQDFRKQIIKDTEIGTTKSSRIISISPDYNRKNIDVRLNQGSPGKHAADPADLTKNVYSYSMPAHELDALDKITALPMYEAEQADSSKSIRDLVKFRIAVINNDNPTKSVYLHFRAFLTEFGDNYKSDWQSVNFSGRGETFYNYGGKFERGFSIGFGLVAQSKAELIPMYSKMNYLASIVAPDYTQAGFMRGNLVKLTVGDYLVEQPGFIKGVTYEFGESPWEIGIKDDNDATVDESVGELPIFCNVKLDYTPIHTFLPRRIKNLTNPEIKFIGNNTKIFDNLSQYTSYKQS